MEIIILKPQTLPSKVYFATELGLLIFVAARIWEITALLTLRFLFARSYTRELIFLTHGIFQVKEVPRAAGHSVTVMATKMSARGCSFSAAAELLPTKIAKSLTKSCSDFQKKLHAKQQSFCKTRPPSSLACGMFLRPFLSLFSLDVILHLSNAKRLLIFVRR